MARPTRTRLQNSPSPRDDDALVVALHSWGEGRRPRELSLLAFPVIAVLLAVVEIGDLPPEDRGVESAWFVAASAAAAIAGGRYGALSSLRKVDSAARPLSTNLATVVVAHSMRFVGLACSSRRRRVARARRHRRHRTGRRDTVDGLDAARAATGTS
jgi:hypothetical protein